MSLINIKAIEQQAKKEMSEEISKAAVEKLKTLYRTKEKAALALKNIEREIESYLADIHESSVYESAGVDMVKE